MRVRWPGPKPYWTYSYESNLWLSTHSITNAIYGRPIAVVTACIVQSLQSFHNPYSPQLTENTDNFDKCETLTTAL